MSRDHLSDAAATLRQVMEDLGRVLQVVQIAAIPPVSPSEGYSQVSQVHHVQKFVAGCSKVAREEEESGRGPRGEDEVKHGEAHHGCAHDTDTDDPINSEVSWAPNRPGPLR